PPRSTLFPYTTLFRSLPPGVGNAGVLDNREQRRQLLERLARRPAARLLLACDPRRSPDRGTLALLGELSRSAMQTRVWLLPVDTEATRLSVDGEALLELYDTPGLEDAIELLDYLERLAPPGERLDGPARIERFLA